MYQLVVKSFIFERFGPASHPAFNLFHIYVLCSSANHADSLLDGFLVFGLVDDHIRLAHAQQSEEIAPEHL